MNAPAWWAGLAPAFVDVECGGVTHRVRWDRGALHADDHDDVTAEAALAVLGGEPPACIALLDMWRRQSRAPELVTLGRRPGEADIGFGDDTPLTVRQSENSALQIASSRLPQQVLATMTERLQRRDDLKVLLTMPGPMVDRLVLTALAACSENWRDEAFRATHGLRLGAALSARAGPALRRLGEKLGWGVPDVGVSPARPDGPGPMIAARLEPDHSVVVSAELPAEWLSNVWGRGLSEPDGEFVLAVVGGDDAGRTFDAVVAQWEPAGTFTFEAQGVPATVEIDADGRRHVTRR